MEQLMNCKRCGRGDTVIRPMYQSCVACDPPDREVTRVVCGVTYAMEERVARCLDAWLPEQTIEHGWIVVSWDTGRTTKTVVWRELIPIQKALLERFDLRVLDRTHT
jgi:hypothetical protein